MQARRITTGADLDPTQSLVLQPHLDYIQVESVLRLLRELAEPDRIVVVATHDERLLALADRVVHLSQPVGGVAAA